MYTSTLAYNFCIFPHSLFTWSRSATDDMVFCSVQWRHCTHVAAYSRPAKKRRRFNATRVIVYLLLMWFWSKPIICLILTKRKRAQQNRKHKIHLNNGRTRHRYNQKNVREMRQLIPHDDTCVKLKRPWATSSNDVLIINIIKRILRIRNHKRIQNINGYQVSNDYKLQWQWKMP